MFVTDQSFDLYPYMIPGLSKLPSFQDFVDQEEARYLREVLGDNLYDAFTAGLNALPSDWVSTAPTVISTEYVHGNNIWEALTVQTGTAPIAGSDWALVEANNRWLLLKNGNTYLMNGKNYRWIGMVEALKPLIYSLWTRYGVVQLTVNGFVVPVSENSGRYEPKQPIGDAWNDWSRYIGGKCKAVNTLYGYLYNSADFNDVFDNTFKSFVDYLDYEFTEQGNQNFLDL